MTADRNTFGQCQFLFLLFMISNLPVSQIERIFHSFVVISHLLYSQPEQRHQMFVHLNHCLSFEQVKSLLYDRFVTKPICSCFQISPILIRLCILILNPACSYSNSPCYVVFELVANMHCNGLKLKYLCILYYNKYHIQYTL